VVGGTEPAFCGFTFHRRSSLIGFMGTGVGLCFMTGAWLKPERPFRPTPSGSILSAHQNP
jgi:hypothetical protein